MKQFRCFQHFAILFVAAALLILPAYGAQISQTELRNFDQFLDSHPQIIAELISACHAPEP